MKSTRIRTRCRRPGVANRIYVLAACSLVVVLGLGLLLVAGDSLWSGSARVGESGGGGNSTGPDGSDEASGSDAREQGDGQLFLYCAAGMRYAVDDIVQDYRRETGTSVQLTYGGSNTLLNQIEVSRTGDLYIAADNSYIELGREKGLVAESVTLALMRPVIVVPKDNPLGIQSVDDLLRDDVKTAVANPEAAAVGRKTRRLLQDSGHWERLEQRVTRSGVFQPTVNEVANDVKIGSVDAGIVWDSTAAQYPELEVVYVPELERGVADIQIAVLTSTETPTEALRFARYVAARDKGLATFRKAGFDVVEGDVWERNPEITFFAGAVNRRALEPIIQEFERREGVKVNTVYNGCGILTAQMRSMQQGQAGSFPDTYMACDVYYLETVQDLFEQGVNVSDTDIVIVVQPGNPKSIRSLEDLTKPGVRVALGQPDQCTIGVLSRRLLEDAGIYEQVRENLVQETPTSAMLVPNITTGSADAVLAYRSDTLAEQNRLEVVPIDSPLSKAVQPFSIARASDHKYLSQRLFDHIARSRDKFESAGFNWRLDGAAPPPAAKATDNPAS